jgi:hypothetical protein
MEGDDPETQARINRILLQMLDRVEENRRILDIELLRLLGLMSIEFNILERDFKYLLIVLHDLPLREARRRTLKLKIFAQVLCEIRKRLSTKISDSALSQQFEQICKRRMICENRGT